MMGLVERDIFCRRESLKTIENGMNTDDTLRSKLKEDPAQGINNKVRWGVGIVEIVGIQLGRRLR